MYCSKFFSVPFQAAMQPDVQSSATVPSGPPQHKIFELSELLVNYSM